MAPLAGTATILIIIIDNNWWISVYLRLYIFKHLYKYILIVTT